jgi:hypothetical protein
MFGPYEPMSSREPAEQSEFWLQETTRILDMHPNDAALTMGAALMLDAPAAGYVKRHVTLTPGPPAFGPISQWDHPTLQRLEDEFERRCGNRCLELADRTCRLEPGEVAWWRLRAVLEFRCSWSGSHGGPRSPRWLEVLDECRQHDPENGLYDYLVARQLWESSADLKFCQGDTYLVLLDAAGFRRGAERFQRAQSQRFVSLDDKGHPATERFLRCAAVPRFDHDDLANSRLISFRRSICLRRIWKWWRIQAEEHERAGDLAEAADCHRQNLHLVDQYLAGGPAQEYDQVATASRVTTAEMLQSLVQEHPEQFAPNVIAEAQRQADCARRALHVLQAAGARMGLPASPPIALYLASASFVGFAPGAIVILLLLGVPCWLAGCWLRAASPGAMGLVGHCVVWLSALTITLVVFGLAPAEVIPASVQAWTLIVLVAMGVTAVLAYAVWRRLRKHRFQYSLRTLLLVILLCPLVLFAARFGFDVIDSVRPELHVPVRGWEKVDPRVLQNAVSAQGLPSWLWVLTQWGLYYGAYLTVALWAALVTLVLLLRRSGDLGRRVLSRKRWRSLPRALGKPATAMAAILLVAYLAMVPQIIRTAEADFQKGIAFARAPGTHWAKVAQAFEAVRAEEATAKQLPSP